MKRLWTIDDFLLMEWHDASVHSFAIHPGENGNGSLVLDIDYVAKAQIKEDGTLSFFVAPAILTFSELSELVISIDYVTDSAGITPFSVQEILREEKVFLTGYTTYKWTINIGWPRGFISFVAKTFNMALKADPIETSSQTLKPDQRT